MARPKVSGLTEHELEVVKILWERSSLSVADILAAFPRKPKPAYTSLLTAIRSMEKKGYLQHVQEGKAFLYSSLLKKSDYKKFEVKRLADRLFGGSRVELAVNLIKDEKLSPKEIQELRDLLGDR